MTLARRVATALIVVATTAGATFAVLLAGGSGQFEISQVRFIYDGVAVAAIVVWLFIAAVRRDWLPSSRLMPAIVACLAAFAIAAVTSRVPRLSVEMLGYAFLLAELYLLLVALMRGARLRAHLERLALVLCLLVCVLYLLQVFQAWQLWWAVVGRLAIPPLRPAYLGLSLGSPNPIATLVLLLGAFALATTQLGGRGGRAVSVVLVVLVAITTVITGSRGAWIGAGAALVVCVWVTVVTAPDARRRVTAFLRTRAGATALVGGLAVLAVTGILAARSGRLTLGDDGYREAFAAASLRMFQSSPLVGVGPGVWQVLRASYQTATEPDLYIPHAHNIYLQTLAESGLVGVIAGVVVAGSLGALVVGALRSGDRVRRQVGLATLFGLVVLAGQQLVDMLMNVPALLLAIAIPLAWLDASSPDPAAALAHTASAAQRRRLASGRLLPLAMAAITIGIGAGLLRIESIASTAAQGVSAADEGHWAAAVAPAREAAANDPSVAAYWFEAGVAAANAGDLATAADALSRGAVADDFPYAWLDLAAVRWRLGDVAGARTALTGAERLGWQRTPVALGAGWLRWQIGDRASAITDYGAALAATPTLANDPFWGSDPELIAATPAIMRAALQQVERSPGSAADHAPLLFALRLIGGDPARAGAELAPLPAAERSIYAAAAAAWQGLPGAERRLQQLTDSDPLDGAAVSWCQLVAARHDEPALVARYGAWLNDGFPAGPPISRIVLGPPLPQPYGGVDRYSSLYRRPVPAAEVLGILPQITFQDHF